MDDRQQRRRLLGLMGALMLDAILGMALTTFLDFEPSKHSAVQNAFVGLHVLIAIGIILGGIVQLISSIKARRLRVAVGVGFFASLVAFAAGGISADKGNDVAVFVMASAFIFALGAYGYSLTKISTRLASSTKK